MAPAWTRFGRVALGGLCIALIVGSGWMIWASVWRPTSPALPASQAPPRAPKLVTPSAFHTEQEWIVYDVISTIAALAAFKPGGPFTPEDFSVTTEPLGNRNPFEEAAFAVTPPSGGVPERLVIEDFIWSPKTFDKFAEARFRSAPGSEGSGDRALLDALTTPTPAVLIQQDKRISALLAQRMDSAAAHEEAALLLGAFGLREYAGYTFTDLRPALARMTAHLAIASALRGDAPRGPSGWMAETVLLALAGREADALSRLASQQREFKSGGELAWARALRMRLTRDWRPYGKQGTPTLLEQVTYARVVCKHVSDTRFLEFLETGKLEPLADWPRTITGPSHYSIESGHLLIDLGLQMEIAEEQQVWREFTTDPWKLEVLNAVPQPGGVMQFPHGLELHVLDWGLWAGFLQRQLAAQLCAKSWFLGSLGLDRDAKRLPSELEETYGLLTLYPIVLRTIAMDAEKYRWAVARAQRIPVGMITPRAWKLLLDKPEFVEGIDKAEPFPADITWFDPLVPAGAPFDLDNRSLREYCERPAPVSQIERWAVARPFDEWVQYSLVWRRSPGVPSFDEFRRGLGPLLEYDVQPYMRLHKYVPNLSRQDRAYVTARLCTFNDNYCADVADDLIAEGREREAVALYERWIARARDTVAVSNRVRWLVRHYLEANREEEGFTLAERAYHVGSGRGMYTYAEALDRLGRHAEAERVYRAVAERYDDPDALGTFLLRKHARTGDPTVYERALETLARAFPDGLERPPVDALPAPPVDGLYVRDVGARASRLGLREGDVLVMIDGVRIRNVRQYYIVANIGFEPTVRVTVWRNKQYRQLTLRFPERWFGVRFDQYQQQLVS